MVLRRMIWTGLRQVEPSIASAYRFLSRPPAPNLWGDRDVEHSWIAAHIPQGPGQGLDFGSGTSHLALVAVRRGFHMIVADRTPIDWPFEHPDFTFVQGDALQFQLGEGSLDLIINCSTVEHLGLARYGDDPAQDADLEGMRHLRRLLKANGIMLLTIPVGEDATYPHLHRVYGRTRLPQLLDGFEVREREFWTKNQANRWILADEQTAVRRPSTEYFYSLGCFILTAGAMAGAPS